MRENADQFLVLWLHVTPWGRHFLHQNFLKFLFFSNGTLEQKFFETNENLCTGEILEQKL